MDDQSGKFLRPTLQSAFTIVTVCRRCDHEMAIVLELQPSFDRLMPLTVECPHCGEATGFDSGRRVLEVTPCPLEP